MHQPRRRSALLVPLTILTLVASAFQAIPASAATTFFVRDTSDLGDATPGDGICSSVGVDTSTCTLRAAIDESNATAGQDTINFSILSGAQTIAPASQLTTITDGVIIDGTSQPGFAGTPLIRIDGAGASSASGLRIAGSNNATVVKGLMITRFDTHGIVVVAPASGGPQPVTITGNYVGTNGTTPLGNKESGITVSNRAGVQIGGTTAAERNVISANDDGLGGCCGNGFGISLNNGADNSVIQGNYIGTNAAGTGSLGNKTFGINVQSANNSIGGAVAGSRNVISGNNWGGIEIQTSVANGNQVLGNYIGADSTGTAALSNVNYGVLLNSPGAGNVIGAGGSGNVIVAAAELVGVAGGSNAQVQGNLLGTAADGVTPIGSEAEGVLVTASASGTKIGGTGAGDGNVIAKATSAGIRVQNSTGTIIRGNWIGTNTTGSANLGNAVGIRLTATSNDNVIGDSPGANVIANSTGHGVEVSGGVRNSIRYNSIYGNGKLGIDLVDAGDPSSGVTANDAGDADTGPNDLLNTPLLTNVAQNGANVDYTGTLDTIAGSTITVDVYKSTACDASGSGEGTTFVGSGSVVLPDGSDPFTISLPGTVLGGEVYTATATDQNGSTSEFSPCFTVPSAIADLEVQINGEPATVTAGQALSYSVDITNHGPNTATGVDLTTALPDSVDTVVATPDAGSCDAPTASVHCTIGAIPNGTTVHVAMSMRTSTTPGALAMSAAATATSGEGPDAFLNTANASVTANDATPGFAPARSYDLAGTGAHSIVTGRFNADGFDDVVVSNSNARASILLGAANGHLGAASAVTLAGTPTFMAAAKVDADSNLDLIANTEACAPTDNVICGTLQLATGNGDGTFDAPVAIDVKNGPQSIALVDVNGDNKRDLIAADAIDKDISVSFGNGDGTFAANATEYGATGSQHGLAVGNIDADNNPDIVVTSGATSKVFINNGSGAFAAPVSYPTGSTSSTPTPTLADLNGDNAPDLVVSGSARVLLNNGAGVFSAATEAVSTSAYSAAAGDFNLDGQKDVEGATGTLTTASPDLVQARGAGDGTFTAGPNATLQYRASTSIVSASLNTNLAADLVIPNGADSKVTVLLGTPTPQVTNLVISHGNTGDTFSAGYSPLDERSLNFAGVELDPAILSGAAGPLDAPLQGRPLQGRPLQGRPLQGRPLQGRPLQGRPLQGRFLTDPPPSAFAFAPFQALVDHPIADPPLITQIGLDVTGGWPAQLQGTSLANLPPQEIDLNEVIGNSTVWNRVKVITLDHFDLTQTALGNLPPVAELAGSAKLVDLAPASNWTDAGGWLDTMSPVCTTDVSGFDPTQKTLVDLALARCPLTVVPWETLRIRDFNLTATNSLMFSYGMLGVDPTSIPLQHGTDPATTLGALTLDNVPTGIVDCSLLACTSAHTLGEAFDLMQSSHDYVFLQNATFTKFLTGGTAPSGAVTADDLIGDMTVEQFLLGAIAPQDFPYVLLTTGQLLDAAQPEAGGAIPYSASFDVACPVAAGTSISFTLPSSRFGFVKGSASFAIGTPVTSTVPAGNPTTAGNVLHWDLPTNAQVCGAVVTGTQHMKLSFQVQPAPATGAFIATAKISTDDNDTLRTVDPTPITLTESGGPKTFSNPQTLGTDELVLGQFSSPDDVNVYKISLTQADVGALVTVVLSNGNETATAGVDNDLMLYGSAEASLAAAPLQGRPLQGRPIGDQEGCLPPGYVLNGQGLEGVPHFDTPTLAVRGFSTNRSDYPEIVCTTVQESDVADGLTIQVSHFAGSTGDHPYVLSHTIERDTDVAGCVSPDFQFDGEGQTPTTAQYSRVLNSGAALPAGAKTLFLINAERFGNLYGWDHTGTQPGSIAEKQILEDLQALASRSEVNGYILPVETGPGTAVDSAYASLDSSPCSVTAANGVVSSINDLVKGVETNFTPSGPRIRPDNVVLVGDDDVIPFARLRDGTTLGNQVAYAPNVRSNGGPNPISKAFARGYILSDEPFGTTLAPLSILGNVVYVADTSLGRLIETPAEIDGQIDQYISVGGLLDPKTRLSTGADFASNAGEQIADVFKLQTDATNDLPNTSGYSTKALLDIVTSGSSWTAAPGWTKAAMLCRLDGFNGPGPCVPGAPSPDFQPPALISVSGHANHVATLAGDGSSIIESSDIAGSGIPDGSLLFTIGCNAGVNVPDSYLPSPDDFDLPQALASRKGSFVGNFGFGYGDTTRLAFSEKLMKLFANNLDGSVTIGEAISQAKGAYWSQLVSSSPYDIKALEQSTLYGLPFYRITGAGNTNDQNAPNTETDPDTGLPSTLLSLPKENTSDQYFVDPIDDRKSEGDGDFFVGPNTTVVPGQPIEPTSNPFFLTQPGLRLHGALVTSLSVQDIDPGTFNPVIARLVLDGTPGQNTEPIVESGVFPTAYSTLTTVQGDDYMVLNGGRFTATGAGIGTQRVYTQETVRALWSDRSPAVQDFTAPDVSASGQLIGNGYATFNIRSLATDVSAAYVMYRPGGGPHPDRFKLVRLVQTAPGLYSATVQVGSDGVSEFFGEVADTAGNVGFDVLKGASVALTFVSQTPPAGVTTQIVPDSGTNLVNGFYSGPVSVVINQRSYLSIGAQVDFGPTQFFYPTGFFTGTTADVDVPSGSGTADGIHRVDYTTGGQTGTVIVPIDGLPPEVQLQVGNPHSDVGAGAPYVTPATPLAIVVTDAASGVQNCTIDVFFPAASSNSTNFACAEGSNPITLGNTDGRYRIRTVATDNAGHSVTTNEIVTVTRDNLAPVITPTVGDPRYPAVSSTPYVRTISDITMNIVDPPAGDVPGSGVATCATTVVGPIPSGGPEPASSSLGCDPGTANQIYNADGADGNYRFDTTATDRLGNTGTGTQTVKLDNTKPTVTVTLPAASTPTYTAGGTTFVKSNTNLNTATSDPASISGPGSGVASCLTSLASNGMMEPPPPAVPTLPTPAACTSPSHTYTVPPGSPDGPYLVTGTATDNVGNENTGSAGDGSSGPLAVTLDDTAPIFGTCPTVPLQRSATVLSASGTGTGTTFTVNEEATAPRVPFVIKVGSELMKVTKRVLVSGTTSQYTYTVARGQGGTSNVTHGTGSEIAWDLLARQDLLGGPTASINNSQTTFQVSEERFGAPATPFTMLIDNEQMKVTGRTTPTGSTFLSTYTVTRHINGTAAVSHASSSKIYWTGDAYGLVSTALNNATGTSLVVQESRFGPPSVPFDITVDGERMTVIQRSVVAATHVATYTVVRGVNGTKAVSHAVGAAVVPPPVGAVYMNSPAAQRTLTIEATDDVWPGVPGSGIASNPSQVIPGATVGTYFVTFTAPDNLGNSSPKTCAYEVIYKFSGFYLPVDMTVVNSRNAGAAVPVKWKITDFNGAGQTSATTFREITASKTIPATSAACSASNPDFSTASEDIRGGSALQNLGGGMWQYNWSPNTTKGTCTTMTVRLRQTGLSFSDPTRWYQYAVFSFK